MDSTTASTYNKVGWHRSNVHFNALCCDNAFKIFNRRQTTAKGVRIFFASNGITRVIPICRWHGHGILNEAPEIKFECASRHYTAILSPVMPLTAENNRMIWLKIGLNWNFTWLSFIRKHRSAGIVNVAKSVMPLGSIILLVKTKIDSKTLRVHSNDWLPMRVNKCKSQSTRYPIDYRKVETYTWIIPITSMRQNPNWNESEHRHLNGKCCAEKPARQILIVNPLLIEWNSFIFATSRQTAFQFASIMLNIAICRLLVAVLKAASSPMAQMQTTLSFDLY